MLFRSPQGFATQTLYLQAKHRRTFSDNALFKEVICAAWHEFSKPSFNRKVDKVGIAIGEACNNSVVRDRVRDVLDWAAKSADADGYYQGRVQALTNLRRGSTILMRRFRSCVWQAGGCSAGYENAVESLPGR